MLGTTYRISMAIAGVALGATLTASALTNVDVTKSNGDFVAGSGIPADNFTTDIGEGVSVYLKARGRPGAPISGQALIVTGKTYVNVTNPTTPLWNFDFQFTPRLDDAVDGRNYDLILQVDTDPSSATDFTKNACTIDAGLFDPNSWSSGDGFFVNPGSGAWSDDDTPYVYSQSWRPGFGFLNNGELTPGDYEIRWAVRSPLGHLVAESEVTARLIADSGAALSLDAQDACLNAGESQLVVEINLANQSMPIVGGQYFLSYDTSKLDFVSMVAGDAPFTNEIFESVDEVAGEIDYAVGIPLTGAGTSAPTTMARITFDVLGDFCEVADLVQFRTAVPPTTITPSGGAGFTPALVDLGLVTKDSVTPSLSTPSPILVNNDPGICEATVLPVAPSVTDDCDSEPTINGVRDDSLPLDAAYPVGVTQITWTAEDDCGNTASVVQSVTVEDSEAPVVFCPPDVTIECDESTDPADVNAVLALTFDDDPNLGASQAPDVWYTDRYAPAGFVSAFFDGDDRLQHSIDAADGSDNRPASFSGAFYDTQGRKLDLAAGTTWMSIDLYVPNAWATTGRRMAGLWGTTFDEMGFISGYPIIEFASIDGPPRFRWYSQDTDQDDSNGYQPGWIDMGLPSGFVYDAWYTLEIELTPSGFVGTVGDLQVTDTFTFGSIEIGNVILQGHNNSVGVTYDIYWDNLVTAQAAMAIDNCDPAPVVTYSDAFTAGACPDSETITRTWTATDTFGNQSSCVQIITVVDTTPPVLFCPPDVTIECDESSLPANTGMPTYAQGFETGRDGWFDYLGALTRVMDGTGGVPSSSGAWHAEVSGAFTRWGGYRSVFPAGGYTTSLDIYLDVNLGLANDTRMDFSSAINDPSGEHRRDFIFHAGFYNSSDMTGPGAGTNRFILNASNNAPGNPKNSAGNPVAVTATGWYRVEHHFYDIGAGVLAVDINVYDPTDSLVYTQTRSNPDDIIGTTVGGNRYGWLLNLGWTLPIDNSVITTGMARALDNCDMAPLVTYSDSSTPGSCAQEETITRTWTATDACGNQTTCQQIITVVDTTPPMVTNCPDDITVKADAGTCDAWVAWTAPTVSDNCGSVTLTYEIDEGDDSSVEATIPSTSYVFPSGTSKVTVVADDGCGNTDNSCTFLVTVDAVNKVQALVELDSVAPSGSFTRCITFEVSPSGGGTATVVNVDVLFDTFGLGLATFDVPCGDYTCITARDTLHTLRRTDDDGDFQIIGTVWEADFTSTGTTDDSLLGGNFNDDEFIDILDFGIFIGQFNMAVGADTLCPPAGSHADASANGVVQSEDFTFIQTQFLFQSEPACPVMLRSPRGSLVTQSSGTRRMAATIGRVNEVEGQITPLRGPVTSITVEELIERGLDDLIVADLNQDGVVDQTDIAVFLSDPSGL
jgi:hypothetical protein